MCVKKAGLSESIPCVTTKKQDERQRHEGHSTASPQSQTQPSIALDEASSGSRGLSDGIGRHDLRARSRGSAHAPDQQAGAVLTISVMMNRTRPTSMRASR